MKLTKILMSGAAVLTPAVVLPLVNAAKVDNSTNATKNTNNKVASNEIITVGTDGWVSVDAKGLVKYHLTFNESKKTCKLDKMSVTCSASDQITLKPQGEYKSASYPQVDKFQLNELDVHGGCSGSGELEWLDFADARYIESIGAQSFDTGKAGGCGFKIRHVSFAGATSLKKIGKLAFWNQYLERDSEDLDFDFSSTQLEEIGEDAFRACCRSGSKYSFTRSIIFPASLTYIGPCAFETYDGVNSFTPRKVIFLGATPPSLGDGGSLPSVATSVSGQTCVIVPDGQKDNYWNTWTQAHSPRHYELGEPIKQSNLIEANIKFETAGSGTDTILTQTNVAGSDSKQIYPSKIDGTQETDYNIWLTNDIDGKLHLTKDSVTNKYTLSWDSDIPAGEYKYKIMATTGSGENLTAACTETKKLVVNDVSLSGGSSIIRASNYNDQDKNIWNPHVSTSTIDSIDWSVVADDTVVQYVHATSISGTNSARITWDNNDIEVGTYKIQIKAVITSGDFKFTATAPISFVVEETYYKISVLDSSSKEVTEAIHLSTTGANQTTTLTVKTLEGTDPGESEMVTPRLSIEKNGSLPTGIAFEKTGTGQYKLDLTASTDSTKGLTVGSYQFYVYSSAKIEVSGIQIDYPIYSQTIVVNVTTNDADTPNTCTGGSDDLTSYYGTSGQDSKTWDVGDKGTITGLKITKAAWESLPDQRMTHISASQPTNHTFNISWDERFTLMESWWEVVDFNVEFDATFTSETNDTSTQHFIVPITMSIRNAGETKSTAGSRIYGYPQTSYELSTEPWQMYSNGSDLPVTTQVDYWIDDSNLEEQYQGKITMRPDPQNIGQAYLSYSELPSNVYQFNICAYDYDNVVYTTQPMTLTIANVATVYGTPTSLSINRGNGRYSQPLSVKVNGDAWTGDVEYTVYNIDEEAFGVDENGYIYWTDKLAEGIYDPMIYATVELEDGTKVTSVPVQIKLTVNPAVGGSNIGAIVGGTVGGVVGAGGAATGGYFGVKKLKAVKGKKKAA